MFAKMEDKFMKFQDFYGNEAVLYSSHNTILIPSCVDLTEIEVLEKTKICHQDIPFQFNNNNRTKSAFLSTDNIIRRTSKQMSCENFIQKVFLNDGHQVIINHGTKATIQSTKNLIK